MSVPIPSRDSSMQRECPLEQSWVVTFPVMPRERHKRSGAEQSNQPPQVLIVAPCFSEICLVPRPIPKRVSTTACCHHELMAWICINLVSFRTTYMLFLLVASREKYLLHYRVLCHLLCVLMACLQDCHILYTCHIVLNKHSQMDPITHLGPK